MIVEVAELTIDPQDRETFCEVLVRAAHTVLAQTPGYRHHRILACCESADRLILTVEWDSIEAHTVGFRQSPAFAQWRALIGPFFREPPAVAHFEVVADD